MFLLFVKRVEPPKWEGSRKEFNYLYKKIRTLIPYLLYYQKLGYDFFSLFSFHLKTQKRETRMVFIPTVSQNIILWKTPKLGKEAFEMVQPSMSCPRLTV